WDFGRRYDARGKLDPEGAPRALHVGDALAVTRWDRASDPVWLDSRKLACGWPDPAAAARAEVLCGPRGEARLECGSLRVARVCGSGALVLPDWNALRALTVVEGEVALGDEPECLRVRAGCTVAIPAQLSALRAELRGAHAVLSAVA